MLDAGSLCLVGPDGQELTSLAFSSDGRTIVYVRGGAHSSNWPAEGNLAPNPAGDIAQPKVQVWSVAASGGTLPMAGCAVSASRRDPAPGFAPVSTSTADAVRVPQGYTANVLYAWGDSVGHQSGSPAFRQDAGNTAAEQALQAGMHHDGIHYFPLPYGATSSNSGLLVMNHEYTDDGLLHPDGMKTWSANKVRKARGPAKWPRSG